MSQTENIIQSSYAQHRIQILLQSGATVITKWAAFMHYKVGKLFSIAKWGHSYYKVGQLLKSGANFIAKWGTYYKVGQVLLQIGEGITKWGNC